MDPNESSDSVLNDLLALERHALNHWGQGDPQAYLELSASDVSYFDPYLGHRLDSLAALTELYDSLRGKVDIARDEIVEPLVQLAGDAAVLTFRYNSHGSEGTLRWNCTEVYQRRDGTWKIIHTHWSLTQPELAKAEG